ncbi:hypothetical protein [Streptomyces canus]|uniref:hypothetical protein n=1 Tax=Streptomyces canus TaxID=58343 RepID=UPI0027D91D8C|nr:hypothetical protein [Streptomyces canus]
MGAMIWSGMRERVEILARADKARKAFGAWDKYGGTGHGPSPVKVGTRLLITRRA